MFSGKTTKLISDIGTYCDVSDDNRALLINNKLDTRDIEKVISSHSSNYRGLSSKIDVLFTDDLSSVNVDNYTVIGVDETSLFKDVVPAVKRWLDLGKHIVCSGLDGSYKMEKFGEISELLHLSDKFEKLRAICKPCLQELLSSGQTIIPYNTVKAPFTKKTVIDDNDIGGSEKYIAVCRKHHNIITL